MRILDLFAGAGGAAEGYHRAFPDAEIVGVDIAPQPRYPFEFVQADALEFLDTVKQWGDPYWYFDLIHASPPCQRYIRSGNVNRSRHPDLVPPTLERLARSGTMWVVENVPGAPLRADVRLCGSQFGLAVRRHRWFQFSTGMPAVLLPPCDHSRPITGVYGHPHGANGAWNGMLPGDLATWSKAMDIDWMTAAELANAIPPAYTQFIGDQLAAHLDKAAS